MLIMLNVTGPLDPAPHVSFVCCEPQYLRPETNGSILPLISVSFDSIWYVPRSNYRTGKITRICVPIINPIVRKWFAKQFHIG